MEKKFDKEYFTRDRIRLATKGSFQPQLVSDEYLQIFADCGFDWVVVNPQNAYGEVRDKILDFCDKNGIEVYLDDRRTCFDADARKEYEHHVSYCGSYINDEPGTDEMENLAAEAKKYIDDTGLTPLINLLPMYANNAQLKYGAGVAKIEYYDPDPDLYYKYCTKWAQLTPTDFICFDVYPLNCCLEGKTERATYANYIENINIFARVARENNKDFYAYIQAYGWNPSMRHADTNSLRWQIYSMMAFGCKGIVFWAYGTEANFNKRAIVDLDGNPTPLYYDVQYTIKEIRKLEKVYLKYKNIGAFNVNYSDELCRYLKMTNPVSFPAIKSIEGCTPWDEPFSPLLVGCFEAKEGNGKAFTIVNMRELITFYMAKAKFTLDEQYTKVVAYYKGEPTELVPDENGVYTVELECGEGVFVTID